MLVKYGFIVLCVFSLLMVTNGDGSISRLLQQTGFISEAQAQEDGRRGASQRGGGTRDGARQQARQHDGDRQARQRDTRRQTTYNRNVHHRNTNYNNRSRYYRSSHHSYGYPFYFYLPLYSYPSRTYYNKYDAYDDDGTFTLCRAHYIDGTYPGQVSAGACSIIWGKRVVHVSQFQTLSGAGYNWVETRPGTIPEYALIGGNYAGRNVYVCSAPYGGKYYAGRIIGDLCYLIYGSEAIPVRPYLVLTK